eukprot:gene24353-30682_t
MRTGTLVTFVAGSDPALTDSEQRTPLSIALKMNSSGGGGGGSAP